MSDALMPVLERALPWLFRIDHQILSYTLLGLTVFVMAWAGRRDSNPVALYLLLLHVI